MIGFKSPKVQVLRDMVPIGGIIMWSGEVPAIPVNYSLCDGNGGTVNLVDRFVRGIGGSDSPGGTGGADSHQHNPGAVDQLAAGVGPDVWTSDPSDPASSLPPYYELAFIQRIS